MNPSKPVTMKRLHNFARKLKTSDLRYRSLQLSRDVFTSMKELQKLHKKLTSDEFNSYSNYGHVPSLSRFIPDSQEEVLSWDFLSPTILFCSGVVNCPRHNTPSFVKYALSDNVRQVVDSMNKMARQRGRVLVFQEILYAYMRVNPMHGTDYIVDMLLLYRKFKGIEHNANHGRKVTVPVRRHAYLQQSFGNLEIVESTSWRQIQNELYAIRQLNEEANRRLTANRLTGNTIDEDLSVIYSSGGSGAVQNQLFTQPQWKKNLVDPSTERQNLEIM